MSEMIRARALATLLILPLLMVVPSSSAQISLDCPISTLFADSTPEQTHLSMTQNPTEMQVSWATPGQTDSVVEYGLDGELGESASGSSECYNHDMVFHTATMTGLQSASNYSYRVGDGSDWSSTFSFYTLPTPAASVKFLAFGDHGMSDNGMQTSQNVLESDADFLILSGDISYANGEQSVWDDYFRDNEPSMSGMPWMMVPGNHENEATYEFDAYETRLEYPSDSNTDFWHSFDVGPVHFAGISTEHDYSAGSAQNQWLAQDLAQANANRGSTPWLVVYGHKPMYTSHGDASHDEDAQLRTELETLFVEQGVDLVIWGHDHYYERTWPVINSTVQDRGVNGNGIDFSEPGAPIHIIAGTAGRESYDYDNEQPEWVYYREKSYGMLVITADTDEMRVEYQNHGGEVGDAFTLYQVEPPAKEEEPGILPGQSLLLSLCAFTLAAARGRVRPSRT
jgi:predicted phosphodiesterase